MILNNIKDKSNDFTVELYHATLTFRYASTLKNIEWTRLK